MSGIRVGLVALEKNPKAAALESMKDRKGWSSERHVRGRVLPVFQVGRIEPRGGCRFCPWCPRGTRHAARVSMGAELRR